MTRDGGAVVKKPCRLCGASREERPFKLGGNICRPCDSAEAVRWARRNREKKRLTNNRYHSSISDRRAAKTRQYRERNPLRRAAHQAVQTALRNGSLVRRPCAVCGATRAHAHHDDYNKPLAVAWLCHPHHMERHSMLAARAKETKHG